MEKVLKKSRYIFFIENSRDEVIIYHSATGFILLCSESEYIQKAEIIEDSETIIYDESNDLVSLLYNKGVLLDIDFDEDAHIRQMYEENVINRKQLMLTLIVTRQCNFRCVYCGQKHENKRMMKDTYDAIIEFIKKMFITNRFKSVSVSFFGGEPLLEYNNIIYFLHKLREFSKESGISYYAGMTTNAYLLTPEKFTKLAELGCLDYQITLDGMDYTHDKKRYLIGNKPTWKTIVENLIYIKSTKVDFSMSLRTNFDTTVLDSIEEYLDFVSTTLKDDRILLYYETIKDHGNVKQTEYISNVEAVFSNVEISKLLREKGLKSSIVYHSTLPYCSMCRAGIPNFYVIDYDSGIKKCTHRLDSIKNKIGYLEQDGQAILYSNLNAQWNYKDYLSMPKCQTCKLLPLCFGKKCPVCYVDDELTFECNQELEMIELEEIISAHV